MTTVYFEGLEFYGYHGVPTAERELGHRYRVDVQASLVRDPAKDDLRETVDYAELMALVTEIGVEGQFQLVESLAHEIAGEILQRFRLIGEVCVRVAKLLPPAPFMVAESGCEVTLTR
jgi:7,8-dihydroneopterin aldolase/epimerase/oxygenase